MTLFEIFCFKILVSYAFQHIPAGVGQVRDVVSQAENYTDRHQLHQSLNLHTARHYKSPNADAALVNVNCCQTTHI